MLLHFCYCDVNVFLFCTAPVGGGGGGFLDHSWVCYTVMLAGLLKKKIYIYILTTKAVPSQAFLARFLKDELTKLRGP